MSLYKGFLLYTVLPNLPKVINLLMLPVFTAYLTERDYGIAAMVYLVQGVGNILKTLGFTIILQNEFITKSDFRFSWSQIFTVISVNMFLLAIFLVLPLFYLLKDELDNYSLVILCVLSFLPLMIFESTIYCSGLLLRLKEKYWRFSVYMFIHSSFLLLFNYIFIVNIKFNYMGWYMSAFLANFLLFLLSLSVLRRSGIRFTKNIDFSYISRKLKISLQTIPHNLSGVILDISDRYVMRILNFSMADIGRYSFAYKFSQNMELVEIGATNALSPRHLKYLSKGDVASMTNYRKDTFVFQIVILAMISVFSLWLRELFDLLVTRDELKSSYPIAIIVMFCFSFRPLYAAGSNVLYFQESTRLLWQVTLSYAVLNILINIFLVPSFGLQIAALSTLFSVLGIALTYHRIKTVRVALQLDYGLNYWVLVVFVLVSLCYYLADSNAFTKVMFSLFFASVALFTVNYFKKKYGIDEC